LSLLFVYETKRDVFSKKKKYRSSLPVAILICRRLGSKCWSSMYCS